MKNALALLLVLPVAASGAPVIGVASAVRGSVKAAGVVLETGKQVFSHDKVSTGPDSKLQILLLDETSFTVGPNSEMELDEFVYDPANPAGGKVNANILKGNFRFVTGKIARRKPDAMRVKTPVGTIGIRGTMAAGSVNDKEGTFVLLGPGPQNDADEKPAGITVGNEQGETDIDQDGWGVTVKLGEAPGKPFQLTGGQLDGLLNPVASAPKGGSNDGGDQTAAKEASGEDTAAGKTTAAEVFAALDAQQSEQSSYASQQFGVPTQATWADVLGIQAGKGTYSGSGVEYYCGTSGTTCGGSPTGTMNFTLAVDFGAKTVGGSGSTIFTTQAGSASTINTISYATFNGDAKYSFSAGNVVGPGAYDAGVPTTLKILNAGGVTAGAVSLDVRWQTTGGQPYYGGSMGGNLQPQ